MPSVKTIIIIAGPTAVGKTAAAIDVAGALQTEIISADSRQCFRELNIGVARPSPGELVQVPHHFIASHSIHEEVTAATFETFALQKAAELFRTHDTIVMTGGTGLYIRAFCEGLDSIPAIDPVIRQRILDGYEQEGLPWLQQQLQEKDPLFYEKGEILNPRRVMRALEVLEATGRPILDFRKGEKAKRDFRIVKRGLELPRKELYSRIDNRVENMMEKGLLEEAKGLLPFRHLNALQTVGYKELFEYFEGKMSLNRAVELIKQSTRHYAKRQMTWFKRDEEYEWEAPGYFTP